MPSVTRLRAPVRLASVLRVLPFYLGLWGFNLLRYWGALSDDDQWALWQATMVRLGDVPVRDFVIIGDPLDLGLSLLFQTLLGPTALSEYLLATSVLTLGTMLFVASAKRAGIQGGMLGVVYLGLFLAAARIDIHSTAKHIVLGLTAFTVCCVPMVQWMFPSPCGCQMSSHDRSQLGTSTRQRGRAASSPARL